jgi:PhnB protein
MPTSNIYLTFDGNCREAFDFYRSVFGTDYEFVGTFSEMPAQEGMPPMNEETGKRIMHMSLPVDDGTRIMGSDNFPGMSPPLIQGNNFSIMISADSKEKADEYFTKLAQGGEEEMPMQDTFWGSYFGSLKDRYGIAWMISFSLEE